MHGLNIPFGKITSSRACVNWSTTSWCTKEDKLKTLPIFLRITLLLSVIGTILSLGSFAFPKLPVGTLCFYFGGLWVFWNGCIFIKIKNKIIWLTLLWAIIDVSILIMFLSVTSSVGDVRHSQGTEIVWGIAYLPIFLVWIAVNYLHPYIWVSPEKTFDFVESWFGKAYGGVIADWLAASIFAASQLLLVIVTLWGFEMWRKGAPTRRRQTDG